MYPRRGHRTASSPCYSRGRRVKEDAHQRETVTKRIRDLVSPCSLSSTFHPPIFPIFRGSLPFSPAAVATPRTLLLSTGEIGRSVVRATGFPALGSSAVRRPGRSSETAGPPVALPAPARGFRAGVLSLLYSGDQSASSFLEAFCLFRLHRHCRRCCCCCHCRLPTPFFLFTAPLQLYALRFAPLALHPLRIFLSVLRVLVAFVFHLPFRLSSPYTIVVLIVVVVVVVVSLVRLAFSLVATRHKRTAFSPHCGRISRFLRDNSVPPARRSPSYRGG